MAKTYGLFNLKLKEGVAAGDFEAEVARQAPEVTMLPGVRMYILKVDRGARIGQYVMVYEFESEETRNRYFPSQGDSSPEYQQWARANAMNIERLNNLAEIEHSADIVEMASTGR